MYGGSYTLLLCPFTSVWMSCWGVVLVSLNLFSHSSYTATSVTDFLVFAHRVAAQA